MSKKRDNYIMKACMIAAPSSGSGKTTITMGLLRALKDRGLDVCGYKTGPDYIDRAYLEAASGKPAFPLADRTGADRRPGRNPFE